MIKRFIPIFLGFSLMFGSGVNSNINNIHKEVIETKAADAYEGSFVKTDFTSLKDGDIGLIVNGSNYAMSNDNGTSKPPTAVLLKDTTNNINYFNDSGEIVNPPTNLIWTYKGTSSSFSFLAGTTGSNYLYCTSSNNGVRVGTNTANTFSYTNNYLYNITNERYLGVYNGSDWRCYTNTTGNIKGQAFSFYKLESTTPSVTLSSDSSSTLNIFKGDTGNVKFLVKNITDVTKDSWSFAFSEGQDNISLEGSTLDSNSVGTVSITASTIGTSKFTVSVNGTSCETTITINVVAKPASMTVVHDDIKEGNILEIATGDSKTVKFSGKDTDGNDYAIKAADVTAKVTSGSDCISLGETTEITGTKAGGGVVTFTLTALPSITASLTIKVIDDYPLSVKAITFADNLESEANENPVEAIFSERSASTYFEKTQDIALECFTFSYEDNRESGLVIDKFSYDITKGSDDENGNKNQTIYVFCSLDTTKTYSYSITIKDKPISGLLVDGKAVENESAIGLNIQRNSTKQLNVAVTPDNTTLDKTIEYVLDKTSDERITVSETGLVTVGNVLGEYLGMVTARSKADPNIYVEFYINATLEDMTVTADFGEEKWETATSVSVGDKIVIYNASGERELTGINDKNVGVATSYTENGTPNCTYVLTVENGYEKGTYALAFGSKYLSYSGSSNTLNTSSELSASSSWKISFSGTNATIINSNTTTKTLKYNSNKNQERFVCYSSGVNGTELVQIYKKSGGTSTITVGSDLINAIEEFNSEENFQCDPQGVTFNSEAWANNSVFTDEIKSTYKLANVEVKENGNEVEKFLYNYDIVISKMKKGFTNYQSATDFLNRFAEGGINYTSNSNQNKARTSTKDQNIFAVIAIISFVGVTSIGGYFFLRKRKYN